MKKEKLSEAFVALFELMTTLREPGGCPWDAQQTDDTIKMYLLEEAYEVLDALESGTPEEVCGELGDLLFQIIFLARLAEERGEFDLLEVIQHITGKMRHRHPHVFDSLEINSVEEVAENWARIKKTERDPSRVSQSTFRSIPPGLPALLRTHRLTERVSKEGREEPRGQTLRLRLEEEFEALRTSMGLGDRERVGEGIGTLLFHLAHLARIEGFNAEHLLRKANETFIRDLETGEDGTVP